MNAPNSPVVLLDLVAALRLLAADDPLGIERFAATLVVGVPSGTRERAAATAIVRSLEHGQDARGASVLLLLARLGRRELRERAVVSLAALRRRGVTSPIESQLSAPATPTARVHTVGGHELVVLDLHRAGAGVQIAWLLLGGEPTVVLAGEVTVGRVREAAVDAVHGAMWDLGSRSVANDELRTRLGETARNTRAAARPVEPEAAIALCLIWSALGGLPDKLEPLPLAAAPPSVRDAGDRSEGPDRLNHTMDSELAAFEGWITRTSGRQSPEWRVGDFVAGAMIAYRFETGEHLVTRWTTVDVVRFLLEWLPRRVVLEPDDLADVPAAAAGFLRFLSAEGRLEGASLDDLLETCTTVGQELLRRPPVNALSPRAAAVVRALSPRRPGAPL